jgi:uncharacterized membrane protein
VFRRRVPAGYGIDLVPRAELGESPLWPLAAIVTAASLYATLPSDFVTGTAASLYAVARWVVPALTLVLLVALLLILPQGRLMRRLDVEARRYRIGRRVVTVAMIAILTAANGAAIFLLVHILVNGGNVNPAPLLRAGIHLWVVNVLVFALWFWQLDAGGPVKRLTCEPHQRDFLFPQQTEPEHFAGWQPTFIDYLYVAFTNASAFSPTDAMPLSRWAKVLMLVQAAISLILAVMVVARAVNILR